MLVVGSAGTKWLRRFTNWNERVAPTRSVNRKSLEIVASRFQNGNPRIAKPPEPVSCQRRGFGNWLKTGKGFEKMFKPVPPLALPLVPAQVPAVGTLYCAEFPPVNGPLPAAPS